VIRAARALLPVIVLLALAGPSWAADLDIVFIGTLSGGGANKAQDQLDGFRLAVRHLGGRLGGMEFTLSVTDDQRTGVLAQQAADRAWQSNHLKILVVSSSGAILQNLVEQATGHRAILLNLGLTPAALAGRECNANLFSLVVRGDLIEEMTGQYLQGQGYHRLAILDADQSAQDLEAFRRGFRGQIIEIKSHRGSMDFSPELRQLVAAKPDAAYFLQKGGMAVELLLQYAAAGLKDQIPLFGPSDRLDETILAASTPAGLDLFSVGPWSDDLDSPANKRLIADFEPEYGRQVSARAAVGYDAAMLIDAAIRASDKKMSDIDGLRAALKRVDFPSTRGAFRFDNDQFPLVNFMLRQVAVDQRGRLINEQRGILAKDVRDSLAHDCPMRAAEPPPAVKH